MNDGKARLALVLAHQDPALLDSLTLPQRLAVEDQLNSLAAAAVPAAVRDRWASGDPLWLVLPDGTTVELVPRGATWTTANLHAYLAQEVAFLGTGYSVAAAVVAECRICPPPYEHEDRTSSAIYLNRAAWTVSAAIGELTFVAAVSLEIQVVFPQDG